MRSSASECASISLPGGRWPSTRRIASVELWSSQISGRNVRKNSRTGPDTNSATRSGLLRAMPLGTSSPITTCRYVTISSARTTERKLAITVSKRELSTCSPSAPMPSDEIVTPSCIEEMNLGGSLVMRLTALARRLPLCSSSRMRVRRDVTSPYSAATKNALSRSRPTRASSSRTRFTGWRTRLVRAYWAADRRPREVPGEYTGPRDDTNVCSMLLSNGDSLDTSRISRGAVPVSAQPCPRHALRLDSQPLHGLRAPLHVLLRPRLRAARRPAGGRPVRHLDPHQGERRRGAQVRIAA